MSIKAWRSRLDAIARRRSGSFAKRSKLPAAKAMIAVNGLRMIVHSIPSRYGLSFFFQ
jgi:hypothetical protein